MTEVENKPILRFYADFPDEWEGFTEEMKAKLGDFLERLQANPYDGRIIENSEKHGQYYGSRVGPLRVYWKVEPKKGEPTSLLAPPGSINILAVERADER